MTPYDIQRIVDHHLVAETGEVVNQAFPYQKRLMPSVFNLIVAECSGQVSMEVWRPVGRTLTEQLKLQL